MSGVLKQKTKVSGNKRPGSKTSYLNLECLANFTFSPKCKFYFQLKCAKNAKFRDARRIQQIGIIPIREGFHQCGNV